MTISAKVREYNVKRYFIEYIPEQFDELNEYLKENFGVTIYRHTVIPEEDPNKVLIYFQSVKGSAIHYVAPNGTIVIDETGDVRAYLEKDNGGLQKEQGKAPQVA